MTRQEGELLRQGLWLQYYIDSINELQNEVWYGAVITTGNDRKCCLYISWQNRHDADTIIETSDLDSINTIIDMLENYRANLLSDGNGGVYEKDTDYF